MTKPNETAAPAQRQSRLPYRLGVGGAVFNAGGQVWIGRRVCKPGQEIEHYWQMPQGGIDEGEDPAVAIVREIAEETGTDKVEILDETDDWLVYDLPDHLIGVAWGGKYRGQRQKWFALRFTGIDADFDLEGHAKPEFSDWRWIELDQLPALIVPFKQNLYHQVVSAFADWPSNIRNERS
jgi:putative (di)nucleoside polyphosphate hydrolase